MFLILIASTLLVTSMTAATAWRLRRGKRVKPGDSFPVTSCTSIAGSTIEIPDQRYQWTHVQFLRFASCPVCNLHLRSFRMRAGELQTAGIREVIFFHSSREVLGSSKDNLPFDVVADPERIHFAKLGVERSVFATLDPRSWWALLLGYLLHPSGFPDSSVNGLPAEFLVDSTGEIIDCLYSEHSAEGWSVSELLQKIENLNEKSFVENPLSGAAA